MQSIHRELIALMPNAVDRPNQGQMVIRQLETWDDHEAARVTLERFGDRAVSYHVGPDHVMVIRPGGVTQPARLALHIEFDDAIGREPVRFYNDLPEKMRDWRNQNAAAAGHGSGAGAARPQATASQVGFEDFIEELRRNNIRLLLPNGQIDRYRERQPNRWSVPVYDFGGLVQPTMPDFLGDELIDRLLEDAPTVPQPPASAVVFLQRFKLPEELDPRQSITATLLLRVEGFTADGEPNVTFAAQHQTNWVRSDKMLLPGHWRVEEPKMMAADDKWMWWCRHWSAEFFSILAGWRESVEFKEASPALTAKLNAKRKRFRLSPIMATKVIHISKQRIHSLSNTASGAGNGGIHASPHEHVRTICAREISYIRNGKEVRYHFRKAGQTVNVRPRGRTNPMRAVTKVTM